ncbi:MAG: hypothetical protein GX657_12935 [Chloroflexi bacterium]|jgi:hypothetical protein|nr:hypothetical protein [Chloroflexota bacterium]
MLACLRQARNVTPLATAKGTRTARARPGRIGRLGGVFMLLGLLAVGCVPSAAGPAPVAAPTAAPCAVEAASFVAAARAALSTWDEAEDAANAAEGDALGTAIERLTAARGGFTALEAPECARAAKVAITRYMDLTIEVQNAIYGDDCRLCIEEMEMQAAAARRSALSGLADLEPAP